MTAPATAAAAYDYLVHLPSKATTRPDLRMTHLSAHLAYNNSLVDAGKLLLSGPTLASHEVPEITGSSMMFKAASKDEVWELVKANPYAQEGVWDLDAAEVWAFRCIVRKGM